MLNIITKYNGFDIHSKPFVAGSKDNSNSALIYKGENLFKCIAGDIAKDGSHNAIAKAKLYIDNIK